MEMQKERQGSLEVVLSEYVAYNKDDEKFGKHMEKRAAEVNKNRVGDSISDDKQQKVSKSK